MLEYQFYRNCVDWPPQLVDCEGGLSEMVDQERTVSRRTFLKHVNRRQLAALERSLGYERHPSEGLTMSSDWHVSYHRSKLFWRRVYYFKHSSIEYVFTQDGRAGSFWARIMADKSPAQGVWLETR